MMFNYSCRIVKHVASINYLLVSLILHTGSITMHFILSVTDLLGAGFTTFRFEGSGSQVEEVDVPIDVPDNPIPEKRKQFIISILRIDTFSSEFSTGSSVGALTAVEGESVMITVYDNDCEYKKIIIIMTL